MRPRAERPWPVRTTVAALAVQVATATLAVPLAAAAADAADEAAAAAAQTVVVSATRHAMALVDAPAAMSVVTREQIEARGADNLADALRGETGVTLLGRTISGRRTISLRGTDSRHTLVLVDGKRIGASDGVVGHSDFQSDWVAVQDIERIEVVRGPMSVLYGAEALGGVVNIITRAPGENARAGVLAEGTHADGSRGGDGHRLAAAVSGPLTPGLRFGVTAADARREAVASRADPKLSEIEGRHKREASLRMLWLPAAGHTVDAEARFGDEERWADSRERGGARRYYLNQPSLERRHASLGWAADWGGGLDLRSLLRAYKSELDVGNTRSNGVAALRPEALDDTVLEGQLSWAPRSGQLFTTGFERRDEELANSGLPGGRGEARHDALYLQHESQPLASLALTVGLRRDEHSRFGSQWSPRAYAVWQPAKGWVVKGGIGHGFKAPTLKQVSGDYREDEGPNTYLGNAAVRPETNRAVEVGVGFERGALALQAMLFRNDVDDLVVPRLLSLQAGRGLYVYENIDRARLQGLEAAATLPLAAAWTLQASYQYLDAKDGNGQRLEKRPRHTLGLRLEVRGNGWRAGVHAEHYAGQLLATAVVGQPPAPVPSITRSGAQGTLTLSPQLEASLGVDNLGELNLAAKSPLFTYAEAPRTWRLALRARW